MHKSTLKIITILVCISIVIGLCYYLITPQKEIVKLKNTVSNETLFFIYYKTDPSRIVITKKKWFQRLVSSKFEMDFIEECFFYKLNNDTLFIKNYGLKKYNKAYLSNQFKTKIVYEEMENGNAEFTYFAEDHKYIKFGYEFFPASQQYTIDNLRIKGYAK